MSRAKKIFSHATLAMRAIGSFIPGLGENSLLTPNHLLWFPAGASYWAGPSASHYLAVVGQFPHLPGPSSDPINLPTTHFNPENGGSVFIRNVGIYLQVHAALQHRKRTSTSAFRCLLGWPTIAVPKLKDLLNLWRRNIWRTKCVIFRYVEVRMLCSDVTLLRSYVDIPGVGYDIKITTW
jgi:hypothetical protein